MDNFQFFEKFGRPEKIDREAELAALLVGRHFTRQPAIMQDSTAPRGLAIAPREPMRPHIAAAIAKHLVNRAVRLHKLAEHDCNFGLDERQEAQVEKLKAEIEEIAEFAGFNVQTGGDPRGAVVVLYDPEDERAGDGFGGGWPVYR